jgi:hypothetical protein
LICLIYGSSAHSQIAGCTDPLASNYNSTATINNGSCTYSAVSYTPAIRVDPLSDSLVESSGVRMAGGYLWSFNDRGGKACLYRIDTINNNIEQRVILAGATNTDWEEISFDGTYFYIGDFGNNQNGGRTDLKIYKFPFSAIHLNNAIDTIPATEISTINFTYSNQPQPVVPSGYNNSKFDCEAMIVENNQIHLFSKNWADNNTTHYLINSTNPGTYVATAMETLATGFLVTAADKVQAQNIITLLGYQNSGTGNHFLYILSDYKADSFFNGNKRLISLPDATVMGQSEGLCFRNGKYGYISNEKFEQSFGPFTLTVNQKLRSFDISNYTGNYFTQYIFTGNGNWSNAANWKYNLQPPVTIYAGNQITIDPIAGGACTLDIPYTIPTGATLWVKTGKNFLLQGNLTIQ